MSMERTERTTRRSLLATGLAGLAAAAAAMVGRPMGVRAEGQAMVVGGDYTDATSTTTLTSQGQADPTLRVANNGNKGALMATSVGGDGVAAESAGGSKSGVYGKSTAGNGFGVYGYNPAAGTRGHLAGPRAGVEGETQAGVALRGTASNIAGVGLEVSGRVRLLKASGVATIAAGTKQVTVTPGIDIVGDPAILLTPKGALPGAMLWTTTNATGNKFTIKTTVNVLVNTKVSWLIIG